MNDLENNTIENPGEMEGSVTAEVPTETTESQPQAGPQTQKTDSSFEEMLDKALVSLHTGDIVKGTVIQVTASEITINLGYKSDGIIAKNEYSTNPNVDLLTEVNLGDVLEVCVTRVNDGDGNVQVSKRKLDAQTNYKLIEKAFQEKTTVVGRVQDLVKGGVIAIVYGNRVFVPNSQISNRFVEDLSVFKGKEMNFHILEFDRPKRRIVAGRKELATLEQKQRREELYATLQIGQRIDGTVSRITDFGAFIDLGGVDGLVHISELAWRRVRKVSDVLTVGQTVTVTVIDVNPEKNKISLTLKDVNNNPWNNIADKYPIGSYIEGKVVRMAGFGAFVNLEDGVDGLVHISQIANRHIAKPEDELEVGQVITVKVTDVDEENKKISLSKKLADARYADDDDYDDYDDDEYDDDDYDDDYDDDDLDDLQAEDGVEEGLPAEESPTEEPEDKNE
jgi:4-hydroxy-3-methylbut-2-enyl diphosphate reductase